MLRIILEFHALCSHHHVFFHRILLVLTLLLYLGDHHFRVSTMGSPILCSFLLGMHWLVLKFCYTFLIFLHRSESLVIRHLRRLRVIQILSLAGRILKVSKVRPVFW